MSEGVMFGYVPYPAIGYRMGSRQMVCTAMTPVDFTGVVGPRQEWDPLTGVGTNRKEDKKHRQGIAEYIEQNEDYVLNSILVYIGEQDAKFVADNGQSEDLPVQRGVLYLRPGAKFKVGDGGHRTGAFTDVIDGHRAMNDETFHRLSTNGQPIIIVLDDDQVRRAQDFTDLQRNAKPLSASIGQSMDRRQALNRILIERIIKRDDVEIFGGGRRVEFLTDAPGKLSAKTMAYKTIRYASGTLLVGTAHRDSRGWEAAIELKIAADEEAVVGTLVSFWQGMSTLPVLAAALHRDRGVALLREGTWLLSANLIYAISAAVHRSAAEGHTSISEATKRLGSFDFNRGPDSPLNGTLADRDTGKALAGRGAWESASDVIFGHLSNEE